MRNQISKTFFFNESPIQFEEINGQIMVNATQMFAANGANLDNWKRSPITQKYIKALSDKTDTYNLRIAENQLIISKKGGLETQGTWIHERLVLNAARYISVEFELWCDEKLAELFRDGQTSLDPIELANISPELQLANALVLAQQVIENHKQIVKEQKEQLAIMAPKAAYVDEVLDSKHSWTTTTIAKELGKTAMQLNRELYAMRVQFKNSDNVWVLYANHQNCGYTTTRTSTYLDHEGNKQTNINTVWTEKGRNFIHSLYKKNLVLK